MCLIGVASKMAFIWRVTHTKAYIYIQWLKHVKLKTSRQSPVFVSWRFSSNTNKVCMWTFFFLLQLSDCFFHQAHGGFPQNLVCMCTRVICKKDCIKNVAPNPQAASIHCAWALRLHLAEIIDGGDWSLKCTLKYFEDKKNLQQHQKPFLRLLLRATGPMPNDSQQSDGEGRDWFGAQSRISSHGPSGTFRCCENKLFYFCHMAGEMVDEMSTRACPVSRWIFYY